MLTLPSIASSHDFRQTSDFTLSPHIEAKLADIKTRIFNIDAENLWETLENEEDLRSHLTQLRQYEAELVK
jgi:phosphoglycerate dehydrogenase-like enzyme